VAPDVLIGRVITPARGTLTLVGGTAIISNPNWNSINTNQTPDWNNINTAQTPDWNTINTAQTPNWLQIAA
jgi:hypothetical protein